METILGILFFILGAIVGSFLNVVSMRYGTGTISKNRSFCMSCGKKLKWYEMFPILSFFLLRGRCSNCKSKISIENPLIEIITAVLFLLIYLKFDISIYTLFLLIIFSILIVISIYDFHHKVIPDGLVYSFILLALISVFVDFSGSTFTLDKINNIFGGIFIPLPFFMLWLISKGKWMGLGDVKLLVGVGLILGAIRGFSAVFVGFWIGAIVSIALIFYQKINSHRNRLSSDDKQLTMKSEIPLGPFLVVGFILEILFQFELIYF